MEMKQVIEVNITKDINEIEAKEEIELAKEIEVAKESETREEIELAKEIEVAKESETREEIEVTKESKAAENTVETKLNETSLYWEYRKLLRLFNFICFQVVIMVLLLVLYVNLYNNKVYDFIIYFCFGLLIAVMFIATFVLIAKIKFISSKKFIYLQLFKLCKKYLYLSEENIGVLFSLFNISIHIFGSITAFIYVKKYIKRSKKTNNAFLKSLILFCIWGLINIYVIDSFKVYNKVFELTKTETTTATISITITYSGLLYYFETLKNEKNDLINKLIN